MNKNILGLYSKYPQYTGFPEHYEKCKGAYIWSNGKRYIDMAYMGLGSCLLGYNNPIINKAVKKSIDKGSICSLNNPDEAELADILSDMFYSGKALCRFARTGGEAMAVAVKIALENTSKKGILRQGYNGHILETTPCKKFNYNDIESFLDNLDDEIGVVIVEEFRDKLPDIKFFETIKQVCKRQNIILILDAISSGFRALSDFAWRLSPDIIVLGKAISNGYAMSAVVGKKDIMDRGQNTFISSNYWTESIGTAAAIATINELKNHDYDKLKLLGYQMHTMWQDCAEYYGVDIEINQVPQLAHFDFMSDKKLEFRTVFVNIMLKHGILGNTSFYPCFAHTEEMMAKYYVACDEAFWAISEMRAHTSEYIEDNGWPIIQDRPIKIT